MNYHDRSCIQKTLASMWVQACIAQEELLTQLLWPGWPSVPQRPQRHRIADLRTSSSGSESQVEA